MPFPKVKKDEEQDKYISRCMSFLADESSALKQDQRIAACHTAWRQKDMTKEEIEAELKQYVKTEYQTFDLHDVEVFAAGRWTGSNSPKGGDVYSEKDLDDMVAAHNEIGKYIKPNMHLGHDRKLKHDGSPALGWITELKRNGKKLLANIRKVPKKIYDLIQLGAYGRFSPEIEWDCFDTNTGKKFHRVFKGLALLGAASPACNSIDDFINLYGLNKDDLEFVYNDNNEIKIYDTKVQEANTMDEKEIQEIKAKIEKVENENKELITKKEKSEKKYTELETESSKKDETIEKLNQATKEEKVHSYLEMKVKDGVITPAQKYLYVTIAMSDELKSDDKGKKIYEYKENDESKKVEFSDTFDLVKKIIDNKSDVNLEKEKSHAVKVDKKVYTENEKNDSDILDERIHKYMKAQKEEGAEVTYDEAYEHEAREMQIEIEGGAK